MHHLDVLLDLVGDDQSICVSFGLSEDDGLSLTSVANKNICKGSDAILVGAADGQVLHLLGGLVPEVVGQVDEARVLLHVEVGDLAHPVGNRCREEADLEVVLTLLFDKAKDVFDVFFKTKF